MTLWHTRRRRRGLLPGVGYTRWDSENRRTASEKLVQTPGQRGEKWTVSTVVQRELVQTRAGVQDAAMARGAAHGQPWDALGVS